MFVVAAVVDGSAHLGGVERLLGVTLPDHGISGLYWLGKLVIILQLREEELEDDGDDRGGDEAAEDHRGPSACGETFVVADGDQVRGFVKNQGESGGE